MNSDTGKSPVSTGPKPRTCPNCGRPFQNSRGFHKHIYKCFKGIKAEANAVDKQSEQDPTLQQGTGEPVAQAEQKETSHDKDNDADLDVEGQKRVGGKFRKGRRRTLSGTSIPSVGGSESRKSQSPTTDPSDVPTIKTRRSARSMQNSIAQQMEPSVKRKRSPKIAANEIENSSDKKRKVSPEDPLGETYVGKVNHTLDSDEKDKGRKRRPITRSRSSKTAKDSKEGESHHDQTPDSAYQSPDQNREPAACEGTILPNPKEVVLPNLPTENTLHITVVKPPGDTVLAGLQDSSKSPPVTTSRRSSLGSIGSHGDISSPKLKISPLSGGSPIPPSFSPPLSPPVKSPLSQEAWNQKLGSLLSPKGSIGSEGSKGSIPEGDSTTTSHFDQMLTDVRKITERQQSSLEKTGKTSVLTVGAALSSMSSLSQRFSAGSPPLDRSNSLDQAIEQECKPKSEGRLSHDRSSSLPPSISSPPAVSLQQGPQTTPTSPTGISNTPSSPILIQAKPLRKLSVESSDPPSSLPKSPEPPKDKPTSTDTSSSFSIPLNQGPSMAAQSASYFLTGTPPVQGLEFRSQPPSTPHTQVFAYYPSDALIRPKTGSGETQPSVVTHSQQNTIPSPAVTAPPTSNTPPPPPLISTHKAVYPVGESPASSTSPGIHPVVIPPMHTGIPTAKGSYSSYSIAQGGAGIDPMQMNYFVHIHPHHSVHPQHPLSHGIRAMHPDVVYRTAWGYRNENSPYSVSSPDRGGSTVQTTPTVDIQPAKEGPKPPPRVEHVTPRTIEERNEFRCTQCGKYFKNKKALNGHMRKHGGAHGHKTVVKKEPLDPVDYSEVDPARYPQNYHEKRSHHHRRSQPPSRFTFPPGNSMDVLLEVAEQARQKEEEERQKRVVADVLVHGVGTVPRKRPENISIPEYDQSGKRLKSMSPPPVMSPRPSIYNMMSPRSSQPSTPGIMKTRPSFDRDEEPPMIHVGEEYQAEVDDYCKEIDDLSEVEDPVQSDLMWKPLDDPSEQEDILIDWFMEFACSEAVPYKGRNKEYAAHVLNMMNYNVKEAIRTLVLGKSVHEDDYDYRYPGTSEWTNMESKLFRRGFRDHKKKFLYTLKGMTSKTLKELHEYYYTWKKLKPAEYRGRQRHHSDDEELAYLGGWDCLGPEDAFAEDIVHSPTSSVESDSSKSTSLSDEESVGSHNRKSKGFRYHAIEKRYTPDLSTNSRQPYEKSWAPLQQKTGGSLLGEGKFPFDSPGKGSKVSSLAKETKSGHSSGNSDSPKRQKINTKTADDRPGNYPCGFCGITFPSIKSRSAHMKKHKYEDTAMTGTNASNAKK